MDVVAHEVASAVGVVLVWRCIWQVFDEYVYPNNKLVSALVGGGMGLSLLLIIHGVQRDW
jgi:hypothetical protein